MIETRAALRLPAMASGQPSLLLSRKLSVRAFTACSALIAAAAATAVPIANQIRLTKACESGDNASDGRSLQARLVYRDRTVPVASCPASRGTCPSAPAAYTSIEQSAGEASIAACTWLSKASHSGRTCACFLLIGPQCLRMCLSPTAANSAAKAGHSLDKRWNSLPSPEPKFCRLEGEQRTPSLNTSTKPDGFALY